jgi:CubicO group peptidase (beta-lactamase class C family)
VYLPGYADSMPAAYRNAPLTLKHLLMHRSGIPHNDEPPLVDGRFNLKFQPGTRMLYSTPGYGILGKVIEAVTGLAYSDAVRTYIGEPVGARSMRADESFIAPGAYVCSNVADMARFAIGVMSGHYVPAEVLYREAWRPETGTYGYGFDVENLDREDLEVGHGGSNGLPRAHLLIRPRQKSAVVVLAEMRVMAPLNLEELARSVLAAAAR